MVASHTAVPMGTANQRSLFASARESKWLVRATPPFYTLPLGKGQEQHMSPTQGQAYIIGGNLRTSHFAVPKGTAVWLATFVRCRWHPHCKRPIGIFFANCLCLLPLASSLLTAPICCLWHHSLHDPKQSNHARAAAA